MDSLRQCLAVRLTPRRLLVIFTVINMINYMDRGIIPVCEGG